MCCETLSKVSTLKPSLTMSLGVYGVQRAQGSLMARGLHRCDPRLLTSPYAVEDSFS